MAFFKKRLYRSIQVSSARDCKPTNGKEERNLQNSTQTGKKHPNNSVSDIGRQGLV